MPAPFLQIVQPARALLLILALLLLSACASLPPGLQGPPSQALPPSADSELARWVRAAQPDPELSGFRLLPNGDSALDTRLQLAARARRSLDVQYYHVENDDTGRSFLRALRDAALRGVRVRLLLDDLYTAGEDDLLLGLAATPGLELRLFNPFPAGRGRLATRFLASLTDFDRVQRRMHNKLFIADSAVAVAGGRNIGSRYYAQTGGENFLDLDTVVAGALLPRLATLFDRYWNSPQVVPIQRLLTADTRTPLQRQQVFDDLTGPATTQPPRRPAPNDALGYAPLAEDMAAGRLGLVWARAEAYADPPDRVLGRGAQYGGVPLLDVDGVRYNVIERLRRSRLEVAITSPYLIPGDEGLAVMRQARERGVALSVVTNSLAATDEPLVHTAYRRYRQRMLAAGVELYELSSQRTRRSVRLGLFGTQIGRLHAKTAVFDREWLFIGSMNFDPRSDRHNTELGLFIQSPDLARQLLKLADTLKRQGAYRLALDARGALQWIGSDDGDGDGAASPLTEEPDSSLWERLMLNLLAPLVPESLL